MMVTESLLYTMYKGKKVNMAQTVHRCREINANLLTIMKHNDCGTEIHLMQ